MIYCLQTLIRYFKDITTKTFSDYIHCIISPIISQFGSHFWQYRNYYSNNLWCKKHSTQGGSGLPKGGIVAFLNSFNERGYSLFFLNTSENLIWYVKSNLHFKQICIKCPSCTLIKLNPNISS